MVPLSVRIYTFTFGAPSAEFLLSKIFPEREEKDPERLKPYRSSLPFPPTRLEEKYPLLSSLNIIPKSSSEEFIGGIRLPGLLHFPFFITEEKRSSTPNPV